MDGVPLPIVAHLLGHADILVTAKTYAHFMPGKDDVARRASDAVTGFLRENCGNLAGSLDVDLREVAGQGTNVIQFRPRAKH